jgi:hypothetical protein
VAQKKLPGIGALKTIIFSGEWKNCLAISPLVRVLALNNLF